MFLRAITTNYRDLHQLFSSDLKFCFNAPAVVKEQIDTLRVGFRELTVSLHQIGDTAMASTTDDIPLVLLAR